nr:retrovirus-related Pol polyprotein from transposon TNT 1-94 [Tanacetum cinerariifolium]
MSTAEAEYVSLYACCAQVIWMRTQLLDYVYKYNRILMYYDSKSSIAIPCNPNGVVERRNRTLVEAARTMLSAVKVPLFFWAEAIATACFTQNRSLVIPRHEKTPYHIINDRKPSVKFFHIFGSVCYIVRDGENLDKMKEKGDECIFVGYSTQSRAYRVFNKRTRVIMEFIHVNFDELSHMASVHNSTNPVPTCQTMASVQISSDPAPECQTMASVHNKYFGKKSSNTSIYSTAQPTQFHEDSPSTSLISVEEHKASRIKTTSDEQTSPISLTEADEFHQEDSADFDGNS